jgi:hypothetical protein
MTLVPLGLWLAIIGYGIAYTGMQKLGGDTDYGLGKAFRGEAATRAAGTTSASSGSGTTLAGAQQQSAIQQLSLITTQPVTGASA